MCVLLFVLPIFRMLLFIRRLSKYADSFWRGAQKADVNSARVFELKSEQFGSDFDEF